MAKGIAAIRFKQWLDEWEGYQFDAAGHRSKPAPHAYMFALSAVQLRALSGVYRRKRDADAGEGLQRRHDEKRSITIRDFVRYGYPYSSLGASMRNERHDHLKKPGWLPTAIVVNILRTGDERRGRTVDDSDLITIDEVDGDFARLNLPYESAGEKWVPSGLEPIEVIDGQHRLWAFDEAIQDGTLPPDFQLPVVAFHGLDVGWQAYLFWSINISPKRINPSHAFDLFPLLRSEAWLDTFSELKIYREARAQELTELLFEAPSSPWLRRINMLGDKRKDAPEHAGVTQAGWARALMSTFLSPGGPRAARGLFGAPTTRADGPLDMHRAQQAALLIALWAQIEASIPVDADWAIALRGEDTADLVGDQINAAFSGPKTMLNQEQGVRGVLAVANDILFAVAQNDRELFEWGTDAEVPSKTVREDVEHELAILRKTPLWQTLTGLSQAIASFDWRSSDAPGLSKEQQLIRRAYRGGGGYVALRGQLMEHLAAQPTPIGAIAQQLAGHPGGV